MVGLGNVASAQSDQAARNFEAGRRAFEAQDYAAALSAFEAAAEAGMSGPAVHFNIGVAAFRVGRYDRAEAAFRHVADTPEMAPLAHYNLGLVALGTDDRAAAERWFSRAESGASDERLRALATTRLAELR
ncbi:MAG: tetratricopeptide repeat protein, partial [Steroidobacteraceae bacterium]